MCKSQDVPSALTVLALSVYIVVMGGHLLESLLAMVEGWVDCVVWRAGMAPLPHIEQLREMMRRAHAMGGP
ncbi:zinc-dependent metalloprotease, partial [uncultured Bilophila sp.]|uniref:zinc-dependent metalloprotease n=1 Tax=uncultured Bilophila sp. TaxID=529385 RepID=UPI00259685D4